MHFLILHGAASEHSELNSGSRCCSRDLKGYYRRANRLIRRLVEIGLKVKK
jgi:hypothetical protein